MANQVVVHVGGEVKAYKTRTSAGARLAFSNVIKALELAGFSFTVEDFAAPGHLRSRPTAWATGQRRDSTAARVALFQRGQEKSPTPADVAKILEEPGVSETGYLLGEAKTAVGALRIALIGGYDVVEALMPGSLNPDFVENSIGEGVEEARRDKGGHARIMLQAFRVVPGAPVERIEELESELTPEVPWWVIDNDDDNPFRADDR